MAGEKKRASEEIIALIEEQAALTILKEQEGNTEMLEEALSVYRALKEEEYQGKIAQLKETLHTQTMQEHARIEFETSRTLLKKRQSLLDKYRRQLCTHIESFRKTQAYQKYLSDALLSVGMDRIIQITVDESDAPLLDSEVLLLKPLDLGGVIVETDSEIFDFSLESRLNDAMDYFTNNSKLWIRR